jgi:uncharacterized membrane protein YidH (DUF202 family)
MSITLIIFLVGVSMLIYGFCGAAFQNTSSSFSREGQEKYTKIINNCYLIMKLSIISLFIAFAILILTF